MPQEFKEQPSESSITIDTILNTNKGEVKAETILLNGSIGPILRSTQLSVAMDRTIVAAEDIMLYGSKSEYKDIRRFSIMRDLEGRMIIVEVIKDSNKD